MKNDAATEIWHMRSYFSAPGHEVGARECAAAFLRVRKQAAARAIAELGFAPIALRNLEAVELGDPAAPADPPVVAYVSGGVWVASCECGGAEFVDFEEALFMCSSCWNIGLEHAWRRVVLPTPGRRAAIEAILLARPVEKTRSWFVSERVADLAWQNRKRGLPAPVSAEDLAAVAAEEGGAPNA